MAGNDRLRLCFGSDGEWMGIGSYSDLFVFQEGTLDNILIVINISKRYISDTVVLFRSVRMIVVSRSSKL